jgi:hypothetical protein
VARIVYSKSKEEVVAKLEQLRAGRALGQLANELKQRRRHWLASNSSSSHSSIARGQGRRGRWGQGGRRGGGRRR